MNAQHLNINGCKPVIGFPMHRLVPIKKNPQGFIHPVLIEMETGYLEDEAIAIGKMADWYREREWGELETRDTAHEKGV